MSGAMHTQDRRTGPAGRAVRVAFTVWAAVLSLFVCITFAGVTVLTIGMWLTDPGYTTTNPVIDLGFFALGGILIGAGFVAQVRGPERKIAGVQQAVIGLLALGAAGLIGDRVEPLVGALLLLLAAAVLVALHPARRDFLEAGTGLSAPLAAMAVLGAVPAAGYAARMLALARQAGPSCFLGQCARGDRFAEMAAVAVAIVLVGVLAALRTRGWRLSAWSAGAATIIVGLASVALPDAPGAVGRAWGTVAVAWGVLLVAAAEWEARQHPEERR